MTTKRADEMGTVTDEALAEVEKIAPGAAPNQPPSPPSRYSAPTAPLGPASASIATAAALAIAIMASAWVTSSVHDRPSDARVVDVSAAYGRWRNIAIRYNDALDDKGRAVNAMAEEWTDEIVRLRAARELLRRETADLRRRTTRLRRATARLRAAALDRAAARADVGPTRTEAR